MSGFLRFSQVPAPAETVTRGGNDERWGRKLWRFYETGEYTYWASPEDSRVIRDHHHLNRTWADDERVGRLREYLRERAELRERAAALRGTPMQLVDPHATPACSTSPEAPRGRKDRRQRRF